MEAYKNVGEILIAFGVDKSYQLGDGLLAIFQQTEQLWYIFHYVEEEWQNIMTCLSLKPIEE